MIKDLLFLIFKNKSAMMGVAILLVFFLMAIFAPLIAPFGPKQSDDGTNAFPYLSSPSEIHLLGTTHAGYDIFSRLIYGTRLTLLIGILTGLITTILSLLMGLLSGYLKGYGKEVISLIINVFLIIPSLPLIIVMAAYVKMDTVFPIIMILSITGWAWGARIVRAQVLSIREKEFIKAAEVLGESAFAITIREILPNMLSLAMVNFCSATMMAIISEATLEFIGLGDISSITWGVMLFWAQNNGALLSGAWWWFLPPGVCIGLLGTSFVLINFAIDEISNPKIRRQ